VNFVQSGLIVLIEYCFISLREYLLFSREYITFWEHNLVNLSHEITIHVAIQIQVYSIFKLFLKYLPLPYYLGQDDMTLAKAIRNELTDAAYWPFSHRHRKLNSSGNVIINNSYTKTLLISESKEAPIPMSIGVYFPHLRIASSAIEIAKVF
jgi:hypothetical protein